MHIPQIAVKSQQKRGEASEERGRLTGEGVRCTANGTGKKNSFAFCNPMYKSDF